MVEQRRPVLTLRFRRARTHERLKQMAGLLGTSMNEIAETAIERELDVLSTDLEAELLDTVTALRHWRYSEEDLERDIAEFAEGEVSLPDPMRTTRAFAAVDDAGIGEIFARRVGFGRSS